MVPCEVVVKSVLPFIRRQFVVRMKKEGKKQAQIAKELGITEAAVSFYLSKTRAKLLSKKAEGAIAGAVDAVYSKKERFDEKVCEICRQLRASGAICEISKACAAGHEKCGVCKTAVC